MINIRKYFKKENPKKQVPTYLKKSGMNLSLLIDDFPNRKIIESKYGNDLCIVKVEDELESMDVILTHDECYSGLVVGQLKGEKPVTLFDFSQHSYDAIVGAGELEPEISKSKYDLSKSHLIIVFQNSIDEEELSELIKEFGGIREDFFGTIVMYIEDKEKFSEVFSFECQ